MGGQKTIDGQMDEESDRRTLSQIFHWMKESQTASGLGCVALSGFFLQSCALTSALGRCAKSQDGGRCGFFLQMGKRQAWKRWENRSHRAQVHSPWDRF